MVKQQPIVASPSATSQKPGQLPAVRQNLLEFDRGGSALPKSKRMPLRGKPRLGFVPLKLGGVEQMCCSAVDKLRNLRAFLRFMEVLHSPRHLPIIECKTDMKG